jgi:hypothetical protein
MILQCVSRKEVPRNCNSPIGLKERRAKKEIVILQSVWRKSAKKISDDPIRIELEILALKMTPHKQNQEWERHRETETETEREAKQARERESSKTWKAKHIPSAIPSLSQSKEEEEEEGEEESVCWEKSVRY